MQDQHKHITGYRDLTAEEIGLMNEGKALAEQAGAYLDKIDKIDGIDRRWSAIARTDLQKGFMALTRAIAKPTTF